MEKTILHEGPPLVYTIDDFISDEECEHFKLIATPHLQRAQVSFDKKGGFSSGRTGMNHWIKYNQDEITLNVANRIAAEVGMSLENAESFQLVHYGVNERYNAHYDVSFIHHAYWTSQRFIIPPTLYHQAYRDKKSEKGRRCLQFGGQRLITALFYLNTVPKGGATAFERLKISVPAEMGRCYS